MHEELMNVMKIASEQSAVAQHKFTNDLILFARPLDITGHFLVGLGYEPKHAFKVRAEEVLRKRSRNMQRFGLWLPCVFADGSWYLLRRILSASQPVPSLDDLAAAQELLS